MKILHTSTRINLSWLFVFPLIFYISSCNYYQVHVLTRADVSGMVNWRTQNKKIIVHQGKQTYGLTEMKVDSTLVSGIISIIDSTAYFYDPKKMKQYRLYEKEITKEVHLYLKEGNINPPYAEIPLTDIKEIRVIEHDDERSRSTTMGLTVGTIMVATIIIVFRAFILSYGA